MYFVFETFISYVFHMHFVLYSQIDLIDCLANAVTSGNFNVEIKNRYSSYKLLALFPPFNSAACPGMSPQQAAFRRKELTHQGMGIVLKKLNKILDQPFEIRCADGLYRRLVPFVHFLNLDGQEIASHTMCNTFNCPVCTATRSKLSATDVAFKIRNSDEVCT